MAVSDTLLAIKRIASHMLGMGHTRLELAGVELAQARQSTIRIIVFSLLAAQVLLIGSVFLVVAGVVLMWPHAPVIALLAAAVLYGLGGWWAFRRVQFLIAQEPPLFEATLSQLHKDKAAVEESLRKPANQTSSE